MTPFQTLIIADGDMSPSDMQISHKVKTRLCLDGAAVRLQRNAVQPDIILGDLDTLLGKYKNIEDIQNTFPHSTIIQTPNQNKTDFEKGLDYVVQNKLGPALCIGLFGKALDHTLFNLSVFARYSTETPLTLLHSFGDQKQWGFVLPAKCCIHTQVSQTTSLIPISETTVTTKGLQWELEQANLSPLSFNSVRNMTQSKQLYFQTQGYCLFLQSSELMPRLEIIE